MSSEYYQKIRNKPLLEREKERELWAKYRAIDYNPLSEKAAIRNEIIEAHLKMCFPVVGKWVRSGIAFDDLFAEASAGLSKAFDKFDHLNGNRFSTYAGWWVRKSVQEYVLANKGQSNVGTSRFSKLLFSYYEQIKEKVVRENPEATDHEIGIIIAQKLMGKYGAPKTLENTLKSIEEFRIKKMKASSLDAPIGDEDGGTFVDIVASNSQTPERILIDKQQSQLARDFLSSAQYEFIRNGKEREWKILTARRLRDPALTLDELSKEWGVSIERIRQIEMATFNRLKRMAERDFSAAARQEQVTDKKEPIKNKYYPTKKPEKTKTIRRAKENPVRDIFIEFKETGKITEGGVALLKQKYLQLNGGDKAKRNWDIFYRSKLKQTPDRNKTLCEEFKLSSNNVSTCVARVAEVLLQSDPLMPSDDYLMFLHEKYLERANFSKSTIDRNWDIWVMRTVQVPKCKNDMIGRVYDIDHSAVSIIMRKMNDLMNVIIDEYPEHEFLEEQQKEAKQRELTTKPTPHQTTYILA